MLNRNNNKLNKLLRYLSTFCFVTASGSSSALYDAYSENEHSYKTAPVAENVNCPSKSVENYQANQLLACVNNKQPFQRIDIRSGLLATNHSGNWRYGWSDNNAFRVIASVKDNQQKILNYSKQTNQYRAQIKAWKNTDIIPKWSGLHAITRYQTADDLYLASIRYDGNVTIKVKHQGRYATLARTKLTNGVKKYLDESGTLATEQWYKINFSAVGEKLTLSLDGIELLSVNNQLLTEGTIGIRTDHVEAYLDDWLLVDSEKSIPETAVQVFNEQFFPEEAINKDCFTHNGQCFQAQNNQGIWETASDNLWFGNSIEYQDKHAIHAIEVVKLEAVNGDIDFAPNIEKRLNGELKHDNKGYYQT